MLENEKKNPVQVELLAPAKNFMAIKASGPYADAVYFGVNSFNMRMNADNFPIESLPKIANLCHNPSNPSFRKRKTYLTTNVVIYEDEITELEKVIQAAKDAEIDAVIVHDLAAIQIAKKIGIQFHISTQCNVSNSQSAKFYEDIGAERIVLARECSLKQIKEITKKMKSTQIEAFIHGAMCSSISGRCYLSQTLSGSQEQSANRGKCTQPCRREWKLIASDSHEFIYDGKRIFNSRDLCMINYIPDLIESGIVSFKIEGRMRHPHYVETVSRVYREAIDAYYNGVFKQKLQKEKWITQLKRVYNRGFTTGFYFNQATIKDSQLNSPANVSHFRYIEMGKILTYHPTGVAKVELNNGTLKLGDKVIVMSADGKHETYFNQIVRDIRYNGETIKITRRATEEKPIIITISVDQPTNGKKIDAIYKFTDSTYSAPRYDGKKRKSSYKLK
ncbi:peptidase U32 family protein [Promethearchaeum syntrophicum]|uniref:Peptidase U32 family protein n=1 Tax=Promethearchaeum syntrophicum TaxID=2594042 RepID=A0A5B9D5Q6_9ARCH|nr:peptidase U32 family protein [Candidatus Prometheoarchaeum syntrophicum]